MSKARKSVICPREPVGLTCEEAATFVGVSSSLFRRAVNRGLMPSPRHLLGRQIWVADELAMALRRLPQEKKVLQSEPDEAVIDWSDVA